MAEYFAQIDESLRTHEDVCHDLTAAGECVRSMAGASRRRMRSAGSGRVSTSIGLVLGITRVASADGRPVMRIVRPWARN
jgi:hypothetical protein